MRSLTFLTLALITGSTVTARAQVVTVLPTPPTISVSGSAEVRVPPDEVLLTLGIETRHRNIDDAKNMNDQRMAALLRFLKDAGIEPKDVQTDYVAIRAEYQRDRPEVTDLYFVQRNVGLRLRKVADFEKVLTGSLKSGVNQVHGIDFTTTELRKHRDAARQLAIRAAREKANDLAKELEVKVGKVLSISENTWGGYWNPRGYNNMSQNVMQNAIAAEPAGDPESGLSVGQISITATVQVSFQLEP
jgi:uncharacterized protein YggE